MTRRLYHLARAADWSAVGPDGLYHGSADDRRDGFLHFSTAEQVVESAARHRAGEQGVLLLKVVEDAVGPWRWEAARSGALFPHLYAPLPVAAIEAVAELPLGPDGRHRFPPLA